jgi:hypothetical protein
MPKTNDSQVFLCKDCERVSMGSAGYQRTIPAR